MLKIKPLSSLVKVFSDEEPKDKSFDRVSIFKNEIASLQIALSSDVDCKLSVEISSELGDSLKAYVVEEIYAGLPLGKDQDDFTLRRQPGKFPELLRPLEGDIELKANEWKSLWLSTEPSGDLPSGEQKVEVSFKGEGIDKKALVTFDVIDCELPKQTLKYTNWFHTDCLATYYGVEVFSDKYWEIVENYLKTARQYGMNTVLTPIFTPPLDTRIGGERPTVQLIGVSVKNKEYSFDFSNLDKWIDMCHRVGVEYFEMAHFFTQWGAWRCPKIIADVDGKQKKIFGWHTRGVGKKYKTFLSALSPKLKEYIRQKGIENNVFFHVSDEPFPRVLRNYKKASNIVKANFGEFQIRDALSNIKFYEMGIVEYPIPNNMHVDDFLGKMPDPWTYNCSGQTVKVSNRFFSMPSGRNRVLGYQLYKFGIHGFLHWGFNFWYTRLSRRKNIDPFTETDAGGEFPSGDSYVVYPGKDGKPLLSLRLKVFYDGLQDMMALQLLESLVGEEKTKAILEEGLDKPLTFSEYPHSDEWQLQTRERINQAIKQVLEK